MVRFFFADQGNYGISKDSLACLRQTTSGQQEFAGNKPLSLGAMV